MKRGLAFLVCLSGCMVGPDYEKPKVEVPTAFTEGEGEKESSEASFFEWWKQFNDPVLDKLLQEVAASNFDLRIAIEKIEEVRALYRIEASKLWPEIDFNASAIRLRNSQNMFDSPFLGPANQSIFQVGFDAIWEIDFFGKFRRSKRAAYFEWEASKDHARDVQIIVLSEAARSYMEIRALQEKIDIAAERVFVDGELLLLTLDKFQAGLSSEEEVQRVRALFENDQAALPLLDEAFKKTVYALGVLLGKAPELVLEEFKTQAPIPEARERVPLGIPSDLLRRRPDIRQAERELAAATELIGAAVANLFPSISLTGTSIGYQSDGLHDLFSPPSRFWSVGPVLDLAVLDFGRRSSFVKLRKSKQKQALFAYEQVVMNALRDVEGALVAYFNEMEREDDFLSGFAAQKRALMLVEDRYAAGIESYLSVLESARVALEAEDLVVDSQRALASNLVALYKALGGEWACCFSP